MSNKVSAPQRKTGFLLKNNQTVTNNQLSVSTSREIEPLVLLEDRSNSLLGRTRKRKKKQNNKRKPRRKTKNKTRYLGKKKN